MTHAKADPLFRIRGRTCPFTYVGVGDLWIHIKSNTRVSEEIGKNVFHRAMKLRTGQQMRRVPFYIKRIR